MAGANEVLLLSRWGIWGVTGQAATVRGHLYWSIIREPARQDKPGFERGGAHGRLHSLLQRGLGAEQRGEDRRDGPWLPGRRHGVRGGADLQRKELPHEAAHRQAVPVAQVRAHRSRAVRGGDAGDQRGGGPAQRALPGRGGRLHDPPVRDSGTTARPGHAGLADGRRQARRGRLHPARPLRTRRASTG